jgi:peptidoglycan hydrolase-like protein with peptidoglycan-binding domain
MRFSMLSFVLVAGLGYALPVTAQNDIGDILTGVAQTLMAQQADNAAYVSAQSLNTASGYRRYLDQYPKGAYRSNAEQALQKLGTSVDAMTPRPFDDSTQRPASAEASIGLTRAQRVTLQRQITELGYPTGGADGLWGANTRKAITRWQTANQQNATGYVTGQQVRLIAQQAGSAIGTEVNEGMAGDDALEERLLGLTYAERREVQRQLTRQGYSTGGSDGRFGRNTRRALAAWQRDEGLRASGYITADQLRELRRQAS